MKGARRFTCCVREAFSCSGARRAHPEEVQIKGDSSPDICIIAGFRSTAGRAFGCRSRAPHRGLPLASPGARHGGGGDPRWFPGGWRWGGGPRPDPATSAARPLPGAAGGGLPAPRLAPPQASGDKGIKGHGRLAQPAGEAPRRSAGPPTLPGCPRALPPVTPGGAGPIVPISAVLGALGLAPLRAGRGCPGTPFSAILELKTPAALGSGEGRAGGAAPAPSRGATEPRP